MHTPVDPALPERLARIRQELSAAVRTAEAELAAMERRHEEVRSELALVLASRARRLYLAARDLAARCLGSLRRPLELSIAAVFFIASRTGLTRARAFAERVLYRADVLPVSASSVTTDQPPAQEAVRWVGCVQIAGLRREALFCHPTSSVTARAQSSGGGRLVAECGLLPQVWRLNVGGAEFELVVRAAGGSFEQARTRTVNPGARLSDRRWHRLRVDLPPAPADLIITLSTRLPPGAGIEYAWAVWGQPRIEYPRRLGTLVRGARAEIQRAGLRGAVRRLRALSSADDKQGYERWLASHAVTPTDLHRMTAEVARLAYQPLISIVTPVYNTDPRWLRACIESVHRQVYPRWELCVADDRSTRQDTLAVLREYEADPRINVTRLRKNSHISAASNAALALATGEFVALLDHDDELAPEALYEVVKLLNEHADADFIYSDEDKLDMAGRRCDAYFKPDWSPELFLSFMYTCHLMVVRRTVVDAVGGFRVGFEGAQDYDLALRVVERTERIHHVPKLLYRGRKIPGSAAAETEAKPWALKAARRALEDHVRRTGLDAEVLPGEAAGLFRIRHRIREQPLVTILVTTDDRSRDVHGRTARLLQNAVRSIVQKTSYRNYELLIVDNGRLSEDSRALLDTVSHRRVSYSYTEPFNFARKLNFSVRHASGVHIVIFNDDLEVISSEWLTAMLEFSQQPEIGAVGGKLFFPDGRLQHIGMNIGVCGISAHAFHMAPGAEPGYAGMAMVIRNCSAVTGACMMTRRAVFDEVGGFDERLAIDFNDTDYCLRVRRAGYRIVYTPYAQLYHLESGTVGPRVQNPREAEIMRDTWGNLLEHDPYYNPNLTREFPDYRLPV